MAVYLICFDKKFKHAKHYIGYSKDINARLKRHRKGNGCSLLRAVRDAGINYRIVRIWPDEDGNFERKLKKRKEAKEFCPICNPDKYLKNYPNKKSIVYIEKEFEE